jgi:hypothetical protein
VSEALYTLAILACPVGMGAMMWFMMRGNKQQPAATDVAPKEAELIRLQAQIDQLEAERGRERATIPGQASS